MAHAGGDGSAQGLGLGLSFLSLGVLLYAAAASCGPAGTTKPVARSKSTPPPIAVSVQPSAEPVVGVEETPPSTTGPAMVRIPNGSVVIGGQEQKFAAFWIDPQSVTHGQYRACVQAKACAALESNTKDGARATVSWTDADAFCRFAGKRLPTEAEWVGSSSELRKQASGKPVGRPTEYTADRHCSPQIGGCGYARVFRRGDKDDDRSWIAPSADRSDIGFRCAWSVTTPADSSLPPPLLEVKPSSPGKIQCETTTCELGREVCCLGQDGVGRCQAPTAGLCEPDNSWSCDEIDDCPSGHGCCPIASPGRGLVDYACTNRPCYEGEVCLPGGRCRTGFQCVVAANGRIGKCEWKNKGARCGARRCSGDTPVCCWDPAQKTGYCAKDTCRSEGKEELYKCSSPRDCGGDRCSKFGYGYGCLGEYAGWLGALCDTVADCPYVPGNSMGYGQVKGCVANPDLPKGVKECVYKSAY